MIDGTLTATLQTVMSPNPNFPSGYNYQLFDRQSFDFDRNLEYQAIYGTGNGGVQIVDLNTMQTLATPTLNQMFEGTSFGETPGVPPSQSIYGLVCGDGTNLYLAMSSSIFYHRLVKVSPVTLKVTGEWFIANGFPLPVTSIGSLESAVVNVAGGKEILIIQSPIGGPSPAAALQIFDGTNMLFLGFGPELNYYNSTITVKITAGARYDTSCDFIVTQGDWLGLSGNVDIWRVNVTEGGAISWSVATLNVLPYFPVTNNLYCGQVLYDTVHDCLILSLTNSNIPDGSPMWFFSVNYDATINWKSAQLATGALPSHGQSRLTSTTLMFGEPFDISILDTRTGEIIFSGGGSRDPYLIFASFYRIWNADTNSYYTYTLAVGFTRYNFVVTPTPPPPGPFESYFTFITCCDRAIMAHLYQFTSATGEQDYFTDFDIDINLLGQIWKSDSLRFEGLQRKLSVGLAVDEQTLKIWATPEDTIFGGSFLSGAEEGLLDGVLIQRSRVVWQFVTGNVARDIQNAPAAIWPLFTGYMGAIEKGGTSHVEFKVKSALVKLNVNMPRNYYQPSCLWTLFDQGCGLSKSDFAVSGIVSSATYNSVTLASGVGTVTGGDGLPNFAQGRLLFTSGVNSGLQVFINTNDSSTLFLAYPLSAVPSSGDTVTFWPGCSKTFDTCHKKFNNTSHIRNFDKVPPVVMSV